MSQQDLIDDFLAEGPWAVAGATSVRSKYGNKVLRCYLQNEKHPLYPINPRGGEIEGLAACRSLDELPEPVRALSIITPPAITEDLVVQAAQAGIRHLWMQPGAESERALELAQEHGLACIAGGACLLVVLGYRE